MIFQSSRILHGSHISKRNFRTEHIILVFPPADYLPCIIQRIKPVQVNAFASEPSVEAFNEAVEGLFRDTKLTDYIGCLAAIAMFFRALMLCSLVKRFFMVFSLLLIHYITLRLKFIVDQFLGSMSVHSQYECDNCGDVFETGENGELEIVDYSKWRECLDWSMGNTGKGSSLLESGLASDSWRLFSQIVSTYLTMV